MPTRSVSSKVAVSVVYAVALFATATTVASAVGLARHVASGTAPDLGVYYAGLIAGSAIALIAAGAAQFVDDRRRGPRGRRAKSSRSCDAGSPRRL